jgi:hypothetical protein
MRRKNRAPNPDHPGDKAAPSVNDPIWPKLSKVILGLMLVQDRTFDEMCDAIYKTAGNLGNCYGASNYTRSCIIWMEDRKLIDAYTYDEVFVEVEVEDKETGEKVKQQTTERKKLWRWRLLDKARALDFIQQHSEFKAA